MIRLEKKKKQKQKKLKVENFSVSLCLHCQDSQSRLESSIPSTIYLNYHSIDQICLEGKKMFLGRANKNGYVQPNQKEKKKIGARNSQLQNTKLLQIGFSLHWVSQLSTNMLIIR